MSSTQAADIRSLASRRHLPARVVLAERVETLQAIVKTTEN